MDKINLKAYPSLNGVTMVPTELWEKVAKFYNNILDDESLSRSVEEHYKAYVNGKEKGFTIEEFQKELESEGL